MAFAEETTRVRIALATCKLLPEPDHDEAPLRAALCARGHDVEPLAWDDPAAEPRDFDLVVLRATWNYHLQPQRFLTWVDRVERVAQLVNPVPVVRWNLHKRYLEELASAGVPVVPTVWLETGTRTSFRTILERTGWDDVVVKPAISAASFETHRFNRSDQDAGEAFLGRLCRERDVMLQPYLRSVEEVGERSLVWIDGEVTHAVEKHPRFAGGAERVALGPGPTPEEIGIASAALARFQGIATYARVDLMRAANGRALVSELEMIEPSLFFPLCECAVERFADALVRTAS